MCARVTLRSGARRVREEFGIGGGRPSPDFRPSYNISPGREVLAVVRGGENRLELFRWGLVPSWARDPSIGNRLINARAETLARRPAYADAFLKRRCLVVVDGFYEWRKEGGRSTPFFVHLKTDAPFGLAGLYERWISPGGRELATCTVITTVANRLLSDIHDRMPAIIPPEGRSAWLDPNAGDPAALGRLLRPFPPEEMEAYRVSAFVNSADRDSPECIRPEGA
ncbi:MAG: SOS response-associated peptidase [Nitrospirota bacterium]|jgi:putative SOS response-associated peptidase YedK